MEEGIKGKVKSPLVSEKIFYKFMEDTKNGISDKRHPLWGNKLDGTLDNFEVGVTKDNIKIPPLDKEEIAYFAELYNMDPKLFEVRNSHPDNFWRGKRVKIGKEGLVLNLNVPEDYINDKILMTNQGVIAPNINVSKKKATYNYVRMSESIEKESNLKSVNSKLEAYKNLAKIESDKFKMAYVAKVLSGKNSPITTELNTYKAQVGLLLEDKIELFNKTIGDKYFNEKVFIHKGLMLSVLSFRNGDFAYQGKHLAQEGAKATFNNTSIFISDPMNTDIKTDIEESINTAME